MLMEYGFTFDVVLQREIEIQLIELNPFGALSGCGGCLFNWIQDAELMYGLKKDPLFLMTRQ